MNPMKYGSLNFLLNVLKYCRRMVEEVECTLGRHNFLDVKFFTPSMDDCRQHCQDTLLCRCLNRFLSSIMCGEKRTWPNTLQLIKPQDITSVKDTSASNLSPVISVFSKSKPIFCPCFSSLVTPFYLKFTPSFPPQILSLPALAPPSPPPLSSNTCLLHNVMKMMRMIFNNILMVTMMFKIMTVSYCGCHPFTRYYYWYPIDKMPTILDARKLLYFQVLLLVPNRLLSSTSVLLSLQTGFQTAH